MAQPPGSGMTALPVRASKGPMTRIDARIFSTSSLGASLVSSSPAVMLTTFLSMSLVILAPKDWTILHMISTSLSAGVSQIWQVPEESSDAAMIGSTAFLAPLTVTSPCSGPLCSTIYLAIVFSSGNAYSFFRSSMHLRQMFLPS